MSIKHTIMLCIAAFTAGVVALYLILRMLAVRRDRRRGVHTARKKLGTMDLILILVAVALLAFTLDMIDLFKRTGLEPATLETCVFAALGGECGIMGWIKTTKERYKEREWQREDEVRRRKENESP